ncbi:phosphatase PAP2 family protein [Spirillospora albida]|uniref:phosphatase PAP2 family protein n=1 Tax=Spirillospora albida TaxID=58123 RepID=UPI00068DFDDE|nr:phosphatase PAP2 family protein [Spirillospora albida]
MKVGSGGGGAGVGLVEDGPERLGEVTAGEESLARGVLGQFGQRRFWVFALRVCGVLLLLYVVTRKVVFWTPDAVFLILLALFAIFGQSRVFLMRLGPFLALLMLYQSFAGIADDLNDNVHYTAMIEFDRWLTGGRLPTEWLQEHLWRGGDQWYDFYFYLLYTFHFVAPLLLATVLWKKRPALYWPFVICFVGLSMAAFLTYLLYPAAPPWMAAQDGYIEPIHRVTGNVWSAMGGGAYDSFYRQLSPNAVAAVPSLHSAYPLLIAVFAAKAFGWRWSWPLLVYPVSIWIGVVYFGEHYVVDVLLGVLYALAVPYLLLKVVEWWRRKAGRQPQDGADQTTQRS